MDRYEQHHRWHDNGHRTNRARQATFRFSTILSGMSSKSEKTYAAYVFKAQESAFINHSRIFISDFMIDRVYRRRSLGTKLFQILLNTYYPNEVILLVADGDGKKFCPKLGFTEIDAATKTMILAR